MAVGAVLLTVFLPSSTLYTIMCICQTSEKTEIIFYGGLFLEIVIEF